MTNTRLMLLLAFCFAIGSMPLSAAIFDGFVVDFGGGNSVTFNAANDLQQSMTTTLQGLPINFVAATIFITEPANELPCAASGSCIVANNGDLKGIANLSDALSINGSLTAGIANIFFVSDGADQATLANFPVFARTFTIGEDGTLQNVGTDFGLAATAVQVGSDVGGPEVPEPVTGVLFVVGLLTVGSLKLRNRRCRY